MNHCVTFFGDIPKLFTDTRLLRDHPLICLLYYISLVRFMHKEHLGKFVGRYCPSLRKSQHLSQALTNYLA